MARNLISWSLVLFGAGGLFFYLYGFSVLDPFQIDWMLNGDPTVHLFGFNFFLQEPWHWPLGFIQNYNAPGGTGLVYADSLPLFSILTKALLQCFSGIPSQPIQLFGVWLFLCFLLQAVCSFLFVRKETKSSFYGVMAAVFALSLPYFLARSFQATRHYSLMAHFLIICGLGFLTAFLKRREFVSWKWIALLFLALGTHFYFFVMVGFLYSIPFLATFERKKIAFMLQMALGLGVYAYALGYFIIPLHESRHFGFGSFSMNLISWFNSDGLTRLLPAIPTTSVWQREGYQYLGAGLLAGLIALLWTRRPLLPKIREAFHFEKEDRTGACLMLGFSFLIALSLSQRLSLLNQDLLVWSTDVIYGFGFLWIFRKRFTSSWSVAVVLTGVSIELYSEIGLVARGSGRMGWVLSDALLFSFLLAQPKKKWLLVCLLIQLIDVSHFFTLLRKENRIFTETKLVHSAELSALFSQAKRVMVLNLNRVNQEEMLFHALEHRLPIGPVYLARSDQGTQGEWVQQAYDLILKNGPEPGTLYVLGNDEKVKPSHEIAGMRFLLKL